MPFGRAPVMTRRIPLSELGRDALQLISVDGSNYTESFSQHPRATATTEQLVCFHVSLGFDALYVSQKFIYLLCFACRVTM